MHYNNFFKQIAKAAYRVIGTLILLSAIGLIAPIPTAQAQETGLRDLYEDDDTCETAAEIATDGISQFHNLYRGELDHRL